MGLVTYLPRAIPLVGLSRRPLPEPAEVFLRYVGVAVMAALVAPDLASTFGESPVGLGPRFVAGIPALAVAFLTRSLGLTVLIGIAGYAAIRFMVSGG